VQGKETVQIYLKKQNSAVDRADKELKAFTKIDVSPGQTSTVQLAVSVSDLAYYKVQGHLWVVEPGKYQVLAGSSSRDIRAIKDIVIK
jgi:beta-glucosidase